MAAPNNRDIRIKSVKNLMTPDELLSVLPISKEQSDMISGFRRDVNNIINGSDKRMLAIIGPCSIHDVSAAMEYAMKLKNLSDRVCDTFFIVMRTYFEKPRSVGGWKGLIVDPDMDDSSDIQKGLKIARKLLLDITEIGLPVGCEMLDPIVPQYIDDIVSWASIGARTTESQTHRSLASGLSVSVGFKNSTSGDLTVAINAIKSASAPASFIGVERNGRLAVFRSSGNPSCHLILRGGDGAPNYYEEDVEEAEKEMRALSVEPRILIDCSHQNSRKDYRRQKRVLRSVVDQVRWGSDSIRGFMLESNLKEGSQKITGNPADLEYGISVTDSCIGWEETEKIVMHAASMIAEARKSGGRIDVL